MTVVAVAEARAGSSASSSGSRAHRRRRGPRGHLIRCPARHAARVVRFQLRLRQRAGGARPGHARRSQPDTARVAAPGRRSADPSSSADSASSAPRRAALQQRGPRRRVRDPGPLPQVSSLGAPLRWSAAISGRVAMVICDDLEFPEWARLPALDGADLITAPVNWPAAPRPPGERPAEVAKAQADTSVNGVFVAVADQYDKEPRVDSDQRQRRRRPGRLPAGRARPGRPGHRPARPLRPGRAQDKRLNDHNDLFADRRPELYSLVAEPPPGADLAGRFLGIMGTRRGSGRRASLIT